MIPSGTTLLAISLLIVAASLASYLFSQWPPFRSAERTTGWMALSLGTTLLLISAAAAVLFSSVSPIYWLTERLGLQQSLVGRRQSEQLPNLPPEQSMREASQALAHDVTKEFRSRAGAMTGHGFDSTSSGSSGSADTGYATPASQSSNRLGPAGNSATLQVSSLVGMSRDAWDATRCVVSYHPDPLDPTRWLLENDCDAPVAVLIATCEQQLSECDERASGLWFYREGGMILPGKYQRSVTYAEQTQYGVSIRYIACIIEQPWAVKLIGQGPAAFSSADLEAAQPSDSCLARAQQLQWTFLVGEARSNEND